MAQNANLRIWGIEGAKTPDSGFSSGEDFLPRYFIALVFGHSSALTSVAPLGSVLRLHKRKGWQNSLKAGVWQVCPRAIQSLLLYTATKSTLFIIFLFEIPKENLLVRGLGDRIS